MLTISTSFLWTDIQLSSVIRIFQSTYIQRRRENDSEERHEGKKGGRKAHVDFSI